MLQTERRSGVGDDLPYSSLQFFPRAQSAAQRATAAEAESRPRQQRMHRPAALPPQRRVNGIPPCGGHMPALTPRGGAGGGLSTRACQRPKQSRPLSLRHRQRLNSSLPTTLELSPSRDDRGTGGRGSPRHPAGLRAAPSSLGPALLPSPARTAILRGNEPRAPEKPARCLRTGSGAIGNPGRTRTLPARPRPAAPALPRTARAAPGRIPAPAALSHRPQRFAARGHGGEEAPQALTAEPGRNRAGRPAGTGAPREREPSPRLPAAKLPPPPPGAPRTADGGSAPAARAPPPPGGQWAAGVPSGNRRRARGGGPGTAEEGGERAGSLEGQPPGARPVEVLPFLPCCSAPLSVGLGCC